jgi:flagellar protein FliO/FliZ
MRASLSWLAAAMLVSSRAVAADELAVAAPMSGFFGELLWVALLALAGWGLVWAARRRQRQVAGDAAWVRVVSATSLGVRERAVVIEVKGRMLLVGVTPQQVTLLTELGAASSTAIEASPPPKINATPERTER